MFVRQANADRLAQPSKDPRYPRTFGDNSELLILYLQGNERKIKPIPVGFSLEGFEQVVKRHTKFSTAVAGAIIGLYLWYLFRIHDLSGWGIFGLLLAIAACGFGLKATYQETLWWFGIEGRASLRLTEGKGWASLGIASVLVFLASSTLFITLLTFPLTWFASQYIIKKQPLKPHLIGAIPLAAFLFCWISDGFLNNHFHVPGFDKKRAEIIAPVAQPSYSYLIGTITANEGAKIRSKPSRNSSSVGTIAKGQTVTILENAGEWYKIRYQNFTTGYIFSSLVSVPGLSQNPGQALNPQVSKSTPPPSVASSSLSSSETTKTDSIQITISSAPIGAVFQVAGHIHGTTPDTVKVKSGFNIFQLTHAGYEDYKDSINVKTVGRKKFHFKLKPIRSVLVGRWEGTMAGKSLVMIITSLNNSSITGYTANSDSNRTDFSGTVDLRTDIITLEEKGEKEVLRKFIGKISSDRKTMQGTWTLSDNYEQTYDWSVNFISSSAQ